MLNSTFIDESGFLLIPHVAKTWTPRGQTPVLRHRYRRDKISVISGVSVSPKRQRLGLFYQFYFQNIGQEGGLWVSPPPATPFEGGAGMVLLDNSRTHQGKPLQDLLRQHSRLRLEYFPSYALELDPEEGVWPQAKRDLANGRPEDLEELAKDLARSIDRCEGHRQGCEVASFHPTFPLFCVDRCIFYVEINKGQSRFASCCGSS